jgi:AAA family ATP:ADP antiporter
MSGSFIRRWVQVEDEEQQPLLWSFAYFFCLLCGYYMLRPVRDEMAIEGGVQHLPWMMTGTFLTLLLATPLFGFVSGRYSRVRLLLSVYLFFIAHLVGFFVAMTGHWHPEWIARVFFVWLSVFNLFVVSVFWSLMADVFAPEQGKRLFGVIAAGGSTGALLGPVLTTGLTYVFPIPVLMLVSALFLTACMGCIFRLDQWTCARIASDSTHAGAPLGGSVLAGVRLAWSSPYLLGICGYLALLTMTATFLYFEQVRLVAEYVNTPEARTRLFSSMDFATNILTWLTQVLLTNRLVARFGLVAALVILPGISLTGFLGVALWPGLVVYVVFSVLRRVGEYALSKPAREMLFTVVSREEKYKAKNFIDTAVSRAGDASTGWLVSGIKALGVTAVQIAWTLVPLMLLWAWLSRWLATEHAKRVPHAAP